MSSQITIVQYFIPEDNDDQEKYNAFIIYKEIDTIRLADIKSSFPLPGNYVFRFKFKYQDRNVWIDHTKEDSQLPKFENKLVFKIYTL